MKIKLLLILLILFLLIIGCGSDGTKGLDYNFKQGINGLQLKMVPNAPPDKIYPQSNFKLILELDNQAAYDLADGVIRIEGIDETYFKLNLIEQSFERLVGRSLTTPAGEKVFLEFEGLSGPIFQNADQFVNNYFVKAFFHSSLEFVNTVCINPNLYEVYDSGCKVKNQESFNGQGAPLAVTEMEEIMYPGPGAGVEFRLLLKNKGDHLSQIRFINVQEAFLGSEQIDCKFQNSGSNPRTIDLKDKKQEIILICKKPLRDTSSYQTSLSLAFTYDYEMKQQERLILVNPQKRFNSWGTLGLS